MSKEMKILERLDLVESSSLSRLYEKMLRADCGTISAFRGNYTRKENQVRTQQLKALLANPKLDITVVDGVCLENYKMSNERESREITFFVTKALPDSDIDIKKILVEAGEKFDQDFILFIPKKGDFAEVIGTNTTGWPDFHKIVKMDKRKFGQGNQFMTKVSNRPFYFYSSETKSCIVSPKTMQFVQIERNKPVEEIEPFISSELKFWSK